MAYSVACLGLEWRVEVSLKSLLGLLKDRLSVAWQHSDDINADVIIYDPASPLAQAVLRREDTGGQHRVMVPCSASDPGPSGLALPIGASRLTQCLERASILLGLPTEARRGERPGLCQRLDDLLQAADTVGVIVTAGGHRGLLNPARKSIHWPHELDADVLAGLVVGEVAVEPMRATEEVEFHRTAQDAIVSIPWDMPLWAVGIGTSGGRLLRRLDAKRPYQLSRWPDFGVLGRRGSDIQCAALLTQKELSPEALAARTGLPIAKVYGFINACALCGLLQEGGVAADTAPGAPVRPESFASGMLKRIRKALSLGADLA